MSYPSDVHRIYEEWNKALANQDVDALLALYHDDATLESPLVSHLLKKERGICEGASQIRELIEKLFTCQPAVRKFYRKNFFTDGETIMWEYPRESPDGDQMDFAEVMQLRDGKIQHHRVYWGWRGFKAIKDNLHGV